MYALAGFLVLFSDESSCLLRIAAKLCLREALSLGFLAQGPNYLCLTYFPLDLIGLKTQFGFLFLACCYLETHAETSVKSSGLLFWLSGFSVEVYTRRVMILARLSFIGPYITLGSSYCAWTALVVVSVTL